MTLHSFFLKGFHTEVQTQCTLQEKDYPEWFHQIATVLRAKQGSELFILDTLGKKYYMQIQAIEKKSVTMECLGLEEKPKESELTLWIPLIKLPKLEIALQMCTQLGVTHFKIFRSEFTDEKIESLSENKKERLLRIITEACEQSERFFLPQIEYISKDLKNITFEENIYVAVERNQFTDFTTPTVIMSNIMIGPEGGWSPSEIEFFKKDPRFYPLDLHCKNILRAETAAVVAVSLLLERNE